MNGEKFSSWLQIVGNVGLIAGLVLVAVQINQNTEIARMQMLHDSWLASQNMYLTMAGENPVPSYVKAINDPTGMTDEDLMTLTFLYAANRNRLGRQEFFWRNGFETFDPRAAAETYTMGDFMGTPFGRAWFELAEPSEFETEHFATVRRLLEQGENPSSKRYLAKLRQAISDNVHRQAGVE